MMRILLAGVLGAFLGMSGIAHAEESILSEGTKVVPPEALQMILPAGTVIQRPGHGEQGMTLVEPDLLARMSQVTVLKETHFTLHRQTMEAIAADGRMREELSKGFLACQTELNMREARAPAWKVALWTLVPAVAVGFGLGLYVGK